MRTLRPHTRRRLAVLIAVATATVPFASVATPAVGPRHPAPPTAPNASDLLEAVRTDDRGDDLPAAVDRAHRFVERVASNDGTAPPVPLTGYRSPSRALQELARRHGDAVPARHAASVQATDDLPDPVRTALARTVDAYLALDTARTQARSDGDVDALLDARRRAETRDDGTVPTVEVDRGRVPATRAQLLDAVADLGAAVQAAGPLRSPTGATCSPTTVAPAFSLDLQGCDATYTTDVHLQIDVGGADTYLNNAGGGSPGGGSCTVFGQPSGGLVAVAALVDLGQADVVYGDASTTDWCGANGGASLGGVGFLVDEGGDDTYHGGNKGMNGGGELAGEGFLLDAGGNDTYVAGIRGTNGGGEWGGRGFLIDTGGHDTYEAAGIGTNGGGTVGGRGHLFDDGGDEIYEATARGTNGGADLAGRGVLVDLRGDDTYDAQQMGANGGGDLAGRGLLVDGAGDDVYHATSRGTNGGASLGGTGQILDADGHDDYQALGFGTNGGGQGGGNGALVDRAGDDTYNATAEGTNGGGTLGGHGRLVDHRGKDTYNATSEGTNGGGNLGGSGTLLDHAGNDTYNATSKGTNGGATLASRGRLVDGAGDDTYRGRRRGVNGGATVSSIGLLHDRAGNDTYIADRCGINGAGTHGSCGHVLGQPEGRAGSGSLIDEGGIDRYEDILVGSCTDCSMVPKGAVGEQVDA